MQIYRAEVEAGLTESLASASVFLGSEIIKPTAENLALAYQYGERDLYYFKSIVVSTGINARGDRFTPTELWEARATVLHKQTNMNHNRDNIVGHAFAYEILDKELNIITPELEAPDFFHIRDTTAIYRDRATEESRAAMASTISEIDNGEWWVSMECRFDGFDYILAQSPSKSWLDYDPSTLEVIQRTEASAYMTRYLREYVNALGQRGPGFVPDGRLIGRQLKGIRFIGKGIVRKPANPNSAIFTIDNQVLSEASELPTLPVYISEDPHKEPIMPNETEIKELDEVKAKLTETEAALTSAKASIEVLMNGKTSAEASLAEANTSLTNVQNELNALKTEVRLEKLTGLVKNAYQCEAEAAVPVAKTMLALTDEAVATILNAAPKTVKPEPAKLPVEAPKPTAPALPAIAEVIPEPAPVVTVPAPAPVAVKSERLSRARNEFTKMLTNS